MPKHSLRRMKQNEMARKKRLRLLSSAFVKTTADKEEKPCSSRRSPQGRRRTASFAIFKKNGGSFF